jgi:para-nitrobenzyl esterase
MGCRFALLFFVAASAFAQDATVTIAEGQLRGNATGGVRSFKGIPYAAPPVGPLRFKPPQPPAAWKGVRNATEFSDVCVQPGPAEGVTMAGVRRRGAQNEDCLYLNVWTAARERNEKRPVMFWIHGGGLQAGSAMSPTYEGSHLAEMGAVVVTINYRLGALGFLALPTLSAESSRKVSGNYGLLDQIEALKWVHRNIAAFGGDPGNVTIFGQSGGSWAVCYLIASPLAKGLFHRGIGESGCGFGRAPYLRSTSPDYDLPSEKIGERWVARNFGEGVTLEALRSKPAGQFNKFIDSTATLDGWVLPRETYEIFRDGKQNHVPVMAGNTADEGSVVVRAMKQPSAEAFQAYMQLLRKTYGEFTDEIVKHYNIRDESDMVRSIEKIFTDSRQVWQMHAMAELTRKANIPAYLYFFTHVPPGPDAAQAGAFHAAEIPYVFGTLNDPRRTYQDADRKLSDTMSRYWLNFAKTGDPNGPGLPKWPMFDPKDERCMQFGDEVKEAPAPHMTAMDIFDRYTAAHKGAFPGPDKGEYRKSAR